MKKLPDTAFATYVRMGESRSHRRVALEFGVTKCAVTKRAKNEGWRTRLHAIEREARGLERAELPPSLAEDAALARAALVELVPRVIAVLESLPSRSLRRQRQQRAMANQLTHFLENLHP